MPPNRPGASSLGGLGRQPSRPSGAPAALNTKSATPSSSQKSGRPPKLLMAILFLNSLIPFVILVMFGFANDVVEHIVGVVFGMFVSMILLGLYRQSLNTRRGDGRFTDWRFSATTLSTLFTVTAWVLGAVNLFIVCLEYSRNFT
jgi:hypothetical protein